MWNKLLYTKEDILNKEKWLKYTPQEIAEYSNESSLKQAISMFSGEYKNKFKKEYVLLKQARKIQIELNKKTLAINKINKSNMIVNDIIKQAKKTAIEYDILVKENTK